jgi:hypothetical protein
VTLGQRRKKLRSTATKEGRLHIKDSDHVEKMLFIFLPARRQKHNDMSQEITGKSSAEKETSVQEPNRDEELAIPNEEEHPKTLEGVSAKEEDDAGKVYPPARKVVVVMIALYLSLFLVSLVHLLPPPSST